MPDTTIACADRRAQDAYQAGCLSVTRAARLTAGWASYAQEHHRGEFLAFKRAYETFLQNTIVPCVVCEQDIAVDDHDVVAVIINLQRRWAHAACGRSVLMSFVYRGRRERALAADLQECPPEPWNAAANGAV